MNKANLRKAAILVLLGPALILGAGCGDNEGSEATGPARAYRASTWSELIGGPDAYGVPGDFILENARIRVVVQDVGESYSTGLYGGSLIDADRVRKGRETCCGHGLDKFQEVVPTANTLVPQVYDEGSGREGPPPVVYIKDDGSNGGPAVISVEGQNSALLSLLGAAVNELVPIFYPNTKIAYFAIDYILYPGSYYVEILTRVRLENGSGEPIPAQDTIESFDMFKALLAGDLVFGDALFFGVDVDIFGPPFGYYLDGYIWDLYTRQKTSTLNQPISSTFLAGTSDRVSYGFASKTSQLQIPLFSSSLSVLFSGRLEYDDINSNEVYFTNYFIVGEGDVASVLDSVYEIRGTLTGTVSGHVVDAISFIGLSGMKVFAFRDPRDPRWGSLHSCDPATNPDCRQQGWEQWVGQWNTQHPGEPYDLLTALLDMVYRADMQSPLLSVMETDRGEDLVRDGSFTGMLEVPEGSSQGNYLLLAHDLSRPEGELVPITIQAGETAQMALKLEPAGRVCFEIKDESGDPVPAKLTLRGLPVDPASAACRDDPMDSACERYGDRQPILGDGFMPDRLALVEHSATGQGSFLLRPGSYEYWASRGPEYTLDSGVVQVDWRHVPEIHALVRRVVNTAGYMSFDVHQHSQKSQDGGITIPDRLITDIAHNVEILNGTDHDYITDYRPWVLNLDINHFIHTIISEELTTFEMGHFIGFPLKYDPATDGNGAPPWIGKTPNSIFEALRREAGYGPDKTVVHVAHPRDSLFGYFYMFGLDPTPPEAPEDEIDPLIRRSRFRTGNSILSIANPMVTPANFSERFESFEVLNSKRLELIRTPTQQEYDSVCEMTDGNEKACRTLGKTTIYDIMERTLWEQDKILHYVPPGREENPYLLASGYKQILDDWFAYLNAGVALTALAGSDSHTKIREEPGVCRNYLRFSTDQPMLATDQEVAGRIWDHQATVSYGPFVEFTASGGAVGSVISDSDGEVNLHVRVETPGWFGVDRIEIYGNGLLIGEIDRDKSVSPDTGKRRFTPWGPGEPKTFEEMACYTKGKEIASEVVAFDEDITCLVDRDTWFVIITMGRQDMFPLYTSNEYPYIQIGALISIAIGSIGLPLPADLLGKNPSTMFAVHPYAMTNPIWVDHDGNGLYDPVSPGPPLPYSRAGLREEAQFIRDLKSHDWAASRAILNRAPLR